MGEVLSMTLLSPCIVIGTSCGSGDGDYGGGDDVLMMVVIIKLTMITIMRMRRTTMHFYLHGANQSIMYMLP